MTMTLDIASIPDELKNSLRDEIAELHCGLIPRADWPNSWNEVRLTGAAERALRETMAVIVAKALAVLPKTRPIERWETQRAVDHVLKNHFHDLLEAMRLPPKVRQWEEEIRRQKEVTRLSTEDLRRELAALKREYRSWLRVRHSDNRYPPIPDPSSEPTEDGEPLPSESGVYFVWASDRVDYVGQSIRLRSRARLGHEHICRGDRLSWLTFPVDSLNFAEAFYIGVSCPRRNFGGDNR